MRQKALSIAMLNLTLVIILIVFLCNACTESSIEQNVASSEEESAGALPERNVPQAKRTPLEEAILHHYENTSDPIFIYEQIPFEDGTLVLAEKLMDGEHYPDLHFIDASNEVIYQTRGSDCWTLNYTQFRGYNIYFGLAGIETRRYSGDQISAGRVEALFSDRTVSIILGDKEAIYINPAGKDIRAFEHPQGYIMPVEGRDMPEDYLSVFKNGEKKSISKIQIERNLDNMPEYLKSKKAEIYNSFAFTFSPMLTTEEWEKGYGEGEIGLEGKTDHRGSHNFLYLRPAGHMGFEDSFLLPQDIKPIYLSNNYVRTAVFSAAETVLVKYPEGRKMLDCRILRLTGEKVEKEIGQDSFVLIETNEEGQVVLPKGKGYYLFLLRIVEGKEIQTYTGMLVIK